jgi:hypothetical protein
MQFYRLAEGVEFEFFGKKYRKIAPCMAEDADRTGSVFQSGAEVTPIGEVRLVSEEEAAKWKPRDERFMLPRAPGQPPDSF